MTRFSLLVLSLAAFAAPLSAQQPPATPKAVGQSVPLDRIIAVVADHPITRFDLQERILQNQQRGVKPPTDPEALRKYELQLVNEMVDEELMLQKAKELKIEVADNELNSAVDRNVRDIKGRFASEAEFRTELAKAGLGTPEEYRRFLIEQMRRDETMKRTMSKLREENKIIPINVSEEEVRAAFEQSKASFGRRPASVTFRQVVIAPKATEAMKGIARAKAESILAELKRGGDFALLAKRESMDPTSKETGGDLGWARRGAYVTEFERWVWGMPPGELSPVVESPFGFHIIRVDRVAAGEVKARHILIMPKLDSTDVKRAHLSADTVMQLWKGGTPFDSLTRKYHDYAAKEETSLLEPITRDSLPESYQKAFANKNPGDIVIFEIPDVQRGMPKVVVAQLVTSTPGGEYTLKETQDMLRRQLADQGGIRRFLDSLRRRSYVSIRLTNPVSDASPVR